MSHLLSFLPSAFKICSQPYVTWPVCLKGCWYTSAAPSEGSESAFKNPANCQAVSQQIPRTLGSLSSLKRQLSTFPPPKRLTEFRLTPVVGTAWKKVKPFSAVSRDAQLALRT